MAAGREDVVTIATYNRHIAAFSDDGVKFNGAYGPRVVGQLDWAKTQLEKPGSRQAVIQIWTPSPPPSKDIPCTLSWQLLARDGVLNAVVTMRSSDIWLGLVYDFFNFSQLTNAVAAELSLKTGELIFNLGSSHLYDRDRLKAAGVLAHQERLGCVSSPRLPAPPPAQDILDWREDLSAPWSLYCDVLQAKSNVDALRTLEVLSE
jgi:thymidylate synthase